MSSQTPPNNNPKPKKPMGIKFSMYWAYAIIIVFLLGMLYIDDNSITKDVSFTKFEEYVTNGGVGDMTVYTYQPCGSCSVGFACECHFPGKPISER